MDVYNKYAFEQKRPDRKQSTLYGNYKKKSQI